MHDILSHHTPLTPEQILASAVQWEALADREEARLTWDKHALPTMVQSKAKLYRQVGADLRAEYKALQNVTPEE